MHSFEAGLPPNAEKNKIRSVCFRGIGCTKFSLALYFLLLLLLLLFLFKNAISSFYLLILFRCSHPSRPKQYKNPFKSLDYNKRYIDLASDTESRLCIIIIIIIYTVQGPVWYLAVHSTHAAFLLARWTRGSVLRNIGGWEEKRYICHRREQGFDRNSSEST